MIKHTPIIFRGITCIVACGISFLLQITLLLYANSRFKPLDYNLYTNSLKPQIYTNNNIKKAVMIAL